MFEWLYTHSYYKVKSDRKNLFYWKVDMNCNLGMLSFREVW